MALQKINWTQIDTTVIPSGTTIQLGGEDDEFIDVYTTDIHISGVSFFDYLQELGYTGVTPTDIAVVDNSGIEIVSGKTLATIYNTTLSPTLEIIDQVGGYQSGTTVAELTGKTFVEFVDELLFPLALPTYTIPTIEISGISSGVREIGATINEDITVYGDKNDAGAYSQLRILRDGSPLVTHSSGLIPSSITDVSDQFGYNNNNNPNYRYTIPTSYSEEHIISYITYPKYITYSGDGNYAAGVAKQDNKGVIDARTPEVRSSVAPQAASNNFNTSTRTITGILPYFYGDMATLPTPASIAVAIAAGEGTSVLASAGDDLSIPYNVDGRYIWVAYRSSYTTKTRWYASDLDQNLIDGTFITYAVTQVVNSPNDYWFGQNFRMHWSAYATDQTIFEYRNT